MEAPGAEMDQREAGAAAAQPAPGEQRRERRRSPLALSPLNRLLFYLMVAGMHGISLLPDFLLERLGIWGALALYRLDRRHVKIGLINLAIAFPATSEAERKRILRASYVNLGRSAAEYIRLGGFFYRRLLRRVTYDGFERWQEIRRRHAGSGAVVLTAHFGNFELLPAAHAMHGQQISLVHHTQRSIAADALFTFVRERAGVEIMRKHSAARAVLRALQQGEMVGVPFDQNAKRSEAIFVRHFGELAATSSGLARLVRIARVPVVPVFIVRNPDQRSHRIVIGEEIPLVHTADAEADIEENTRRFVAVIEEMIRRHPEQFLWLHRRFRTRPIGAPLVYEEHRRGRHRPRSPRSAA